MHDFGIGDDAHPHAAKDQRPPSLATCGFFMMLPVWMCEQATHCTFKYFLAVRKLQIIL